MISGEQTSTSLTLNYFPVRGRGEVIRLLLEYGSIPYTQNVPNWPAYKPDTPFGQLPIITEGNNKLSDSAVIARYVADKIGLLSGPNRYQIESIQANWEDIRNEFVQYFFSKPEVKNEKLIEFVKKVANFLPFHSRILKNNGSNGFYFGNSFTLADFVLFNIVDSLMRAIPDSVESIIDEDIKKVYENVKSNEKLQEYFKSDRYYKDAKI